MPCGDVVLKALHLRGPILLELELIIQLALRTASVRILCARYARLVCVWRACAVGESPRVRRAYAVVRLEILRRDVRRELGHDFLRKCQAMQSPVELEHWHWRTFGSVDLTKTIFASVAAGMKGLIACLA